MNLKQVIDCHYELSFSNLPGSLLNDIFLKLKHKRLAPTKPISDQDVLFCLSTLLNLLHLPPEFVSVELATFLCCDKIIAESLIKQSLARRIFYNLLKLNATISYTHSNIIYLTNLNTSFYKSSDTLYPDLRLILQFDNGVPTITNCWPATIYPFSSPNIFTASIHYGSYDNWQLSSNNLYPTKPVYLNKHLDSISEDTINYPYFTCPNIVQSSADVISNKPPTNHHFFVSNLLTLSHNEHSEFISILQNDSTSSWTTSILNGLTI